jgi:hypothetical protein
MLQSQMHVKCPPSVTGWPSDERGEALLWIAHTKIYPV